MVKISLVEATASAEAFAETDSNNHETTLRDSFEKICAGDGAVCAQQRTRHQ